MAAYANFQEGGRIFWERRAELADNFDNPPPLDFKLFQIQVIYGLKKKIIVLKKFQRGTFL